MSKDKRRILAKLIKRLPFNSLRIFFYRRLLGYEIGKNVRIGKSILLCETVNIGDHAVIAERNLITCRNFSLGRKSKINSGNMIMGMASFLVGEDSRIINNHYFD